MKISSQNALLAQHPFARERLHPRNSWATILPRIDLSRYDSRTSPATIFPIVPASFPPLVASRPQSMLRIHRPFQSATKFLRSYLAITKGYFIRIRSEIMGIVLLSALGALSQGGLIATVGFAVDYLQTPKPTGVDIADDLLSSTQLAIVAVCLLVCLLGVCGSWATYRSRAWSRRLSRTFTISLVSQCLSILATSHSTEHSRLPEGSSGIRKLLNRDTKQVGKAFHVILRGVETTLRFTVALSVLMVINWKLTLSMLPLIILTVPLFYQMYTGIKSDSDEFFNERGQELMGVMRSFTTSMCSQNLVRGEQSARHVTASFENHPDVQRYFTSFSRILLAGDRVKFATGTFSSLALGLALLLGASLVSYGVLTWGQTLAYLMAFWLLLTSLRQLQNMVSRLAFFYPALLRMMTLIKWSKRATTLTRDVDSSDRLELVVSPELPETLKKGVVARGEAVYFVTAVALDRGYVAEIMTPMRFTGDSAKRRKITYAELCFIGKLNRLPIESPIQELIGPATGLSDADVSDFVRHLESMGIADEMAALELELHTVLTEAIWNTLSEKLKIVLLCEVLSHDERPLALIDTRWLASLSGEQTQRIIARLTDKFVLLVSSRYSGIAEHCKWVAVQADSRIIGFGDLGWGRTIAAKVNFADLQKLATEDVQELVDDLDLLE